MKTLFEPRVFRMDGMTGGPWYCMYEARVLPGGYERASDTPYYFEGRFLLNEMRKLLEAFEKPILDYDTGEPIEDAVTLPPDLRVLRECLVLAQKDQLL